ncbi:MAG: hypothetical protein HY855_18330 [Burkholderiales bacterium]|nr:hypothetical protein [Burkholderiales bacterium]
METPVHWDDEQVLLGVAVRAYFFDPQDADGQGDWVARLLPMLRPALPKPNQAEGERQAYTVGDLQVAVDAVFEHGNGLLCVSHRNGDRRPHDPEHWQRQLRVDAMLQSIVAAMAVSGDRQRPTVALLRCHNVVYQFDPGPPVLECLATGIGAAKRYHGEPGCISGQQLAAFCEPQLRALPAPPDGPAAGAQCETAFADTTPSAVAITDA